MKQKFETIIESYINGNTSWVREQVKKLSKENRKKLYTFYLDNYSPITFEREFFFSLI